MMVQERRIIHVDMDAFFAAVEQRDHPEYRGKPVVVGADPKGGRGRGVVSTCSYEARRFGIHSAMPISKAYRCCPHAIFVPGRYHVYRAVSKEIFRFFHELTPLVEPVSIDEAFLDITDSVHLRQTPEEVCVHIKKRIVAMTGLTASVGMAPIKMASKIASDMHKPDGLTIVTHKTLQSFLRPLDIRKLWGIGKKSELVLRRRGIHTIGDLAGQTQETMAAYLGKSGVHFWHLAQGHDPRTVGREDQAKSVSHEMTFEKDEGDTDRIMGHLMRLTEKVSLRLRREGLRGRTISLKIRLEGFETFTRAITCEYPTNFVEDIYQAIVGLYRAFPHRSSKVRLIGVRVSHFESQPLQLDFIQERESSKKEHVHQAVAAICQKYGDRILHRGRSHGVAS